MIGLSPTANRLSWKWLQNKPSLVMNEMNSLTHSCIHSLASFAIFAFSGRAVFIIRATGAKLRMLASDTVICLGLCASIGEVANDDCGEEWDMIDLTGAFS